MADKCAAFMPDINARCGYPGIPVRRACVHEHVLDTVACLLHIADAASGHSAGYCLPCFVADGHDCPITIAPIAEVQR